MYAKSLRLMRWPSRKCSMCICYTGYNVVGINVWLLIAGMRKQLSRIP